MKRVSIKELKSRIDLINDLLGTDIRLLTTTGCGVDLKVNDEWVSKNDKNHLTNKEAMTYLNDKYGEQIREITIKTIKELKEVK